MKGWSYWFILVLAIMNVFLGMVLGVLRKDRSFEQSLKESSFWLFVVLAASFFCEEGW